MIAMTRKKVCPAPPSPLKIGSFHYKLKCQFDLGVPSTAEVSGLDQDEEQY